MRHRFCLGLMLLPWAGLSAGTSELTQAFEPLLSTLRATPEYRAMPPLARSLTLRRRLVEAGFLLPAALRVDPDVSAKVLAEEIYAAATQGERGRLDEAALTFLANQESGAQGPVQAEDRGLEEPQVESSGSPAAQPGVYSPRPASPPPARPGEDPTRIYLIGPRDLLAIAVFTQDQSFTQTSTSQPTANTIEIPVNPRGEVSLPLVGKIRAADRTAEQLEDILGKAFSRFVKDPQVSVLVKDHRAKRVFVVGQVNLNGPVFLQHEQTTLFEVISRAGGFVNAFLNTLEGADPHHIIVERRGQKFSIDFYGDATSTKGGIDFVVEDGDQVFVPKPLHRVRVLGGVKMASELELKPNMTLLEAIAKAGSFTERSRRDQVRLIREGGGRKNTLNVDATKIFHGRETDLLLQPGDVVYVSEW